MTTKQERPCLKWDCSGSGYATASNGAGLEKGMKSRTLLDSFKNARYGLMTAFLAREISEYIVWSLVLSLFLESYSDCP